MRRCTKCDVEKPLKEFYKNAKGKDGRQSSCKDCHRAAATEYYERKSAEPGWKTRKQHLQRLSRHGLSQAEFMMMVQEQGGVCAACEQPVDWRSRDVLQVDHCHVTGEVRGLLCGPCNRALGSLMDDPERLEALWLYALAARIRREEVVAAEVFGSP